MNIKKHITNIRKNGITFIPNVFSKKECNLYIKKSIKLIEMYKKLKRPLSSHNQIINSPFRYEKCFYRLIYNKKIDEILKKLIDKDYILINTNIFNRGNDKDIANKFLTIGDTWHSDSPSIAGKGKERRFRFLVGIMLDNFTDSNAGTLYIPKSHLSEKTPSRYKNYNHKAKSINGNSGDVAIIDASTWHKAGESSNQRRLSIFSYYGPWWIKPYFNYEKMLGKNKLKKLNKNIRKLLHYNSTPPKCPEERSLTVTDYNEVIEPSKIRKKYDYGLITTRRR